MLSVCMQQARIHAYVGFSRQGFLGLGLGVPVTQDMKGYLKKGRDRWLPDGDMCMILRSF